MNGWTAYGGLGLGEWENGRIYRNERERENKRSGERQGSRREGGKREGRREGGSERQREGGRARGRDEGVMAHKSVWNRREEFDYNSQKPVHSCRVTEKLKVKVNTANSQGHTSHSVL